MNEIFAEASMRQRSGVRAEFVGRICRLSDIKTAGAKCDCLSALFAKRPRASTRNTNRASRLKSSNPAVLLFQADGGQKKTGAVLSKNSREFAPGYLSKAWRGRREQKTTALNEPPVPSAAKTHYIAPFALSWPIKKAVVANGEIVFDEVVAPAVAAQPGVADGPEAPNFQSRRSLRRREQKTTEGESPDAEAVAEVAVGERYLTPAGVPVQVLGVAGDQLLVQSLASENRFPIPAGYPLRRWGSDEPAFPVKETPNRPIDEARPTRPPEKRPIAPLIDAMLLAGNMTVKGILRELRRKASAACRGKNLRANIRARMSHLRRRGLQPRLAAPE